MASQRLPDVGIADVARLESFGDLAYQRIPNVGIADRSEPVAVLSRAPANTATFLFFNFNSGATVIVAVVGHTNGLLDSSQPATER